MVHETSQSFSQSVAEVCKNENRETFAKFYGYNHCYLSKNPSWTKIEIAALIYLEIVETKSWQPHLGNTFMVRIRNICHFIFYYFERKKLKNRDMEVFYRAWNSRTQKSTKIKLGPKMLGQFPTIKVRFVKIIVPLTFLLCKAYMYCNYNTFWQKYIKIKNLSKFGGIKFGQTWNFAKGMDNFPQLVGKFS